jgi:hypothetical protein
MAAVSSADDFADCEVMAADCAAMAATRSACRFSRGHLLP